MIKHIHYVKTKLLDQLALITSPKILDITMQLA